MLPVLILQTLAIRLSNGPAVEPDHRFGPHMLLAIGMVLALIALSTLAAIIRTRSRAGGVARDLRSRSRCVEEWLATIRALEARTGTGVWHYDHATGRQEWSDGMKCLFGIDPVETFVEGDAETLLCANDIDLIQQVRAHTDATAPYRMLFDTLDGEGRLRVLAFEACNLAHEDGSMKRVVAMVRDVTGEIVDPKVDAPANPSRDPVDHWVPSVRHSVAAAQAP